VIKLIIFDFDGVIVESVDVKSRAFASLFAGESKESVCHIVEYHLSHGGISRYDKFRYIYEYILHRQLTAEQFTYLCDAFSNLVLTAVIEASFVKGAIEFIEQFHEQYALYIVSATPQDELGTILNARGLGKYFRGYFGASLPKPAAIRKIMTESKSSQTETVFVGDASTDYNAASETGVHFIARCGLNYSFFDDVLCNKISDLRELFDAINYISNYETSRLVATNFVAE